VSEQTPDPVEGEPAEGEPAEPSATDAEPSEPDATSAEGEMALDALDQIAEATAAAFDLPDFADQGTASDPPVAGAPPPSPTDADSIDLLSDVDLTVTIELGRTRMLVEDVLRLGTGSVVELEKLAGDPVDVFVNGRLVARGEVLVLNDNFCVRVNELIAGDQPENQRKSA